MLNKFDAVLEEAIRAYAVDELQLTPFTPSSKRTVCEILRFERLLLENSTNRKTFASYDVSYIRSFTVAGTSLRLHISAHQLPFCDI